MEIEKLNEIQAFSGDNNLASGEADSSIYFIYVDAPVSARSLPAAPSCDAHPLFCMLLTRKRCFKMSVVSTTGKLASACRRDQTNYIDPCCSSSSIFTFDLDDSYFVANMQS